MEQRIGFGKRLGALVLDFVLVCVLSWAGAATIGGMLGGLVGTSALSSLGAGDENAAGAAAAMGLFGAIAGMFIAFALIGTVYFLIEGFTGYTLGKLILGIRIANEDGSAAGVGTLLGRYAVKNCNLLLSIIALLTGVHVLLTLGRLGGLIVLVGCFFALGVKKQALHDMIMHTAVYPKGLIKAS
jgi:uncharacterized RDD family membrane protein YckC